MVAVIGGSLWRRLQRKARDTKDPQLLPEPWQCITHLRLMRAFAHLRHEIQSAAVNNTVLTASSNDTARTETSEEQPNIRDQRWQLYLEQACQRFEAWWLSLTPKNGTGRLRQVDMSVLQQPGKLAAIIKDAKPMNWTRDNLPPLDVLLILHSFMLNPRCFLEDCIRYNILSLWKAGMPWDILDKVIDPSTCEYKTSVSAEREWCKRTKLPWEVNTTGLKHNVRCPLCDTVLQWLPDDVSSQTFGLDGRLDTGLRTGIKCTTCDNNVDCDELSIFKLRHSIENLRKNDTPIPGTILNINGLVRPDNNGVDLQSNTLNELLQGEKGKHILELTEPQNMRNLSRPQLQDLWAIIEQSLDQKPDAQAFFRRLALQVSDTHTIFALDLPAAVVRQGVFVTKMEEIDWLHSPALEYTITDLLARYIVFFKIMEQNKKKVAVPTYAVDLAWHTHQLSPSSYYSFSITNAGNVFIDHDDRIEEGVRTDAFEWTGNQYKQLTKGKEYSRCLCWYCATVYNNTTSDTEATAVDSDGHVRLDNTSDLGKLVLTELATNQFRKLEDDYKLACILASKHQRTAPNQQSFLESYVWPYPRAIPIIGR